MVLFQKGNNKILLLALLCLAIIKMNGKDQPVDQVVDYPGEYVIFINLNIGGNIQTISQNSVIRITFPPGFSKVAGACSPDPSTSWLPTGQTGSEPTLLCNYATNILTITGGFTVGNVSRSQLVLNIKGVLNPKVAGTSSSGFIMAFANSGGTQYASSNQSNKIDVNPKIFSVRKDNGLSSKANESPANLRIQFTVDANLGLNAGFKIETRIPKFWTSYPGANKPKILINDLSPLVTCQCNQITTAVCTITEDTINIKYNIGITGLTGTNIVGDFLCEIGDILSTPTLDKMNNFDVTTITDTGFQIQESKNLDVAANLPGVITISDPVYSQEVNQNGMFTIGFKPSIPINSYYTLNMVISPEISIVNDGNALISIACDGSDPAYSNSYASNLDGTSFETESGSCSSGSNLRFVCTDQFPNRVEAQSLCTISITNMKAYFSIKPITQIELFIKYTTSPGVTKIVDYGKITGITGQIKASAIKSAKVVALDQFINVDDTYSLTIQSQNIVTSAGKLVITFPTGIKCKSPLTLCQVAGSGVNTTPDPNCACDTNTNAITVSNFFAGNGVLPDFVLDIKPITNPPSTGLTYTLQVDTYYNAENFLTDTSNFLASQLPISIQAIPGLITNQIKVTCADSTVGIDTDYDFEINLLNPIPVGGSIILEFATDIAQGTTASNPTCSWTKNADATYISLATCTYTAPSSGNRAKIEMAAINLALPAATILKIKIGTQFIKNPLMTNKPFLDFSIQTYTSPTGSQIDWYNGAVSFKIANSVPPYSFNILDVSGINNKKNGFTSSYKFTFGLKNDHKDLTKLIIELPPAIRFMPGTTSVCSGGVGLAASLSCTRSGTNLMTVILDFSGLTSGDFDVTIDKIQNYISYQQISGFKITTTDPVDQTYVYNYRADPLTPFITNSIPATFDSFTGIITSGQSMFGDDPATDQAVWKFTFQSPQAYPNRIQIILTFPNGFKIGTGFTVTNVENFSLAGSAPFVWDSSAMTLTLETLTVTPSVTYAFSVNKVLNPLTSNPSTQINIETREIDINDATQTYLMDKTIDQETANNIVVFRHSCDNQCRTCVDPSTTIGKNQCTSCYQSTLTLASSNIRYNSNKNTCVGECEQGFFLSGTVCNPCSASCVACITTANTCTKCKRNVVNGVAVPTEFLKDSDQTCTTLCPPGQYGDQINEPFNCKICSTICTQCIDTATKCTQCNYSGLPSYSMNDGVCTTQCPVGQIPQLGVCTNCVSPCASCLTTVDNCLTCVGGFYFLNNKCYNPCPAPQLPDMYSPNCINCITDCGSCVNQAQTCASCNPTSSKPYLFETGCVANCVGNYFEDQGKCVACVSPCEACFSLTACDTCRAGFFQSGDSTCVTSCGSGTFGNPVTGQCEPCVTPCQECQSQNSCISCTTLNNPNKFLFEDTCVAQCPENYVNVGLQCSKCEEGCVGCVDAPNICQSCNTPFLFNEKTQSCLQTCEPTFFPKNEQCVPCQAPCQTCSTAFNQCLSCVDNFYHYQESCSATCPDQYYRESGQNSCTACQSPCLTCTSPTECLSCDESNGFQYKGACLQVCPDEAPIAIGSQCTPCSTGCAKCKSEKSCTQCQSKYLLLNGGCQTTCPAGFQPNSEFTVCTQQSTENLQSFKEKRLITFPYLICCFIFGISTVVSSFQKSQTFIPGCLLGFCSVFEWASWLTIMISQAKQDNQPKQLGASVFVFFMNYVFNGIYLYIHLKKIKTDTQFRLWMSSQRNQITHNCVLVISMLTSFKAVRTLYSQYFGFEFFQLKLSGIANLQYINILTGASCIILSIPIIASSAATSYDDVIRAQPFFFGLDTVIVTIIMIIFTICDANQQQDFFEDHKQNLDNQSLFTQFLLAQGMGREKDGKISERGILERKNSNLELFKEPRTTQREPTQRPLRDPLIEDCDADQQGVSYENTMVNPTQTGPTVQSSMVKESFKPGKPRVFEEKQILNNPQMLLKPIKQEDENDSDGEKNNRSQIYREDDDGQEPIPPQPMIRHTVYYNNKDELTTNGVGVQDDEMNGEFEQNLYSRPTQTGDGVINISSKPKGKKKGKKKKKGGQSRSRSRSPEQEEYQQNYYDPNQQYYVQPSNINRSGIVEYPSWGDHLNESNRPLNARVLQLDELNKSDEENIIQNRQSMQNRTPLANHDIYPNLDKGPFMGKSGFSEKEYQQRRRGGGNDQSSNPMNHASQGQLDNRDQQIFDSHESVRSLSDGGHDFNEISPSDFNILNQRYAAEFLTNLPQAGQGNNNPNLQLYDNNLGGANLSIPARTSSTIHNARAPNSPSNKYIGASTTVAMAGRNTLQNSPHNNRSNTPSSPDQQFFPEEINFRSSYQRDRGDTSQIGPGGIRSSQNGSPQNTGNNFMPGNADKQNGGSVDVNQLKSLEQIYLQRIDNGLNSQDSQKRSSAGGVGKKKQKYSMENSTPLDSAHGFGQNTKDGEFFIDEPDMDF